MSVNNPEGVNLESKRKYSSPSLLFFGNLAGMTASGAGTMVENTSMMVACVGGTRGGMATKYPCA